jgi:DNA invertase Pin-like site-specific DNA recombinase
MESSEMTYPAAYVRKSKRADDSAAAQLAAVRAIAARHGFDPETLVVFDDNGRPGDRGKLKARRGYTAMLEAIERREVSAVFVRVLDRLGRDVEESLRFARVLKESGAGDNLYDQVGRVDRDRLMFTIWAGEKELESAKQRSAFTKAMRQSRGDSALGGHAAPYGRMWARAGDIGMQGDPRRIIEVDNPDEPIAPLLDALAETGGNVLQAAKVLNQRGVPARGGGGWIPRTLARVADAHGAARQRGTARTRVGKETAPLSRIVECHCGTVMTPTRDPRNRRWLSLYCAQGHKLGAEAHGPYVARARHVVERLRAELSGQIELDRRVWTYDPSAQAAERETLAEDLRRLGVAYRGGAVGDEEFASESAAIRERLDEIERESGPAFRATIRRTGPIVRWDGTDDEVGEDLRRAVRVVRLGTDMRPAEVVRRDVALAPPPAKPSKAWKESGAR